jgi:hypothetical protein
MGIKFGFSFTSEFRGITEKPSFNVLSHSSGRKWMVGNFLEETCLL